MVFHRKFRLFLARNSSRIGAGLVNWLRWCRPPSRERLSAKGRSEDLKVTSARAVPAVSITKAS
jgi:hypothetical protein